MNTRRLTALDGLRGFAALAVALFHFFYQYDTVYGHEFSIPSVFQFGYYGVHLFFMVSGFVIFWTLAKIQHPFDFIWSRFSRLFPVYWVAVSITFIIVLLYGPDDRVAKVSDLIVNYSMLQAYIGVPHVDGVYWTLTLELAFYFWMFLLFMFRQTGQIEKWLLGWVLVSAGLALTGAIEMVPMRLRYLALLDYIGLFAAGICFYRLWEGNANRLTYLVIAISFAALYAQYAWQGAVIISVIYFLFYCAITDKIALLSYKPFVFLGTISYSFYLIHQNIGYTIINLFYQLKLSPFLGISCALLTGLILGSLLTYTIEKPAMAYLRKLYKGSSLLNKIANIFSPRTLPQ